MAWRTLFVTNPAKLSVKQGALMIVGEERVNIPFDDLAVILIANPQVLLTVGVMARAAQTGTLIITCDDKLHPSGVFSSFHRHSRQTGQLRLQLSWSAPFKKRLHQRIIQNKVANQAQVLIAINSNRQAGKVEELSKLAQQVMSGDKTRVEAHAAAKYFKELFKTKPITVARFTRELAVVQNAALNYGYAVVRAAVARAIVAHGFLPAIGIFHDSELNAYNLADDLMEPLRPLVDYAVVKKWPYFKPIKQTNQTKNSPQSEDEFSLADRQELVNLLYHTVIAGKEQMSLLSACEELVKSLVTASITKNPQKFIDIHFPAPIGTTAIKISHKAE